MSDIVEAREVFQKAGLAFPAVPADLAACLKRRDDWLYSTRSIDVSPYDLDYYVDEFREADVMDYVVLSHSGHGVNSYALQYYLVRGSLGLFLYLGWGGVYMDGPQAEAQIRQCFTLADEIVFAAGSCETMRLGARLTIVGSDFYGSYWALEGQTSSKKDEDASSPVAILVEVRDWLSY